MTTPPNHPPARHLGLLGVALYALLSPSGKIISSAAAATLLIGGLVTQLRPPAPPAAQAPAPTPVVPTRLAHSGSAAPVFAYIEVDGQTLPVVLTENPTGNSSVGHGPASGSPSLGLSGGGGGRGPGAGSPHFGPRQGSPSPGSGGLPPKASQSDGNPMPPSTTGPIPPLPRTPDQKLNCTPSTVSAPDSESPNALPPGAPPCPTHLAGSDDLADNDSSEAGSPPPQGEPGNEPHVSSPGNVPGGLSEAPGSQFPPENEAGAPMPPPQDEPRLLESPFPGNVPNLFEAPESEFPTGTDDPLNPLIPLSAQLEPLLTAPYDSQSPPQIAEVSPAAEPEPSVIALMLLGLAALGWTGRRRLTPTRRA